MFASLKPFLKGFKEGLRRFVEERTENCISDQFLHILWLRYMMILLINWDLDCVHIIKICYKTIVLLKIIIIRENILLLP